MISKGHSYDDLEITCLFTGKGIGTVYRIKNKHSDDYIDIRLSPKKTVMNFLGGEYETGKGWMKVDVD